MRWVFLLTLFIFALLIGDVLSNTTSGCGQMEVANSYLDIAVDMITKAKNNMPSYLKNCKNETSKPMDCAEAYATGSRKSGVYTIWPVNRVTEGKSLDVYCDMTTEGGGWTLIQRRGDFGRPKDYFFKEWKSYKEGFGDIEKDFWLGNDNIFALTNQKQYSARFDLKDVQGTRRYAKYDNFWIDDENNKYTLHVSDYSGDAGDSLIKEHNNKKFSTKDQDNDMTDVESCAQTYKGAWWYNACHVSNLNGLYLKGPHETFADGMNWYSWKGHKESLESTEIKIRPKNFRLSTHKFSTSSETPSARSNASTFSQTPLR